jgi:hypothetical protein
MSPIIPVPEHSEYALVWDLARELAKLDGRTAEALLACDYGRLLGRKIAGAVRL